MFSSVDDLPRHIRSLPMRDQKRYLNIYNAAYANAQRMGKDAASCEASAFAAAAGVTNALAAQQQPVGQATILSAGAPAGSPPRRVDMVASSSPPPADEPIWLPGESDPKGRLSVALAVLARADLTDQEKTYWTQIARSAQAALDSPADDSADLSARAAKLNQDACVAFRLAMLTPTPRYTGPVSPAEVKRLTYETTPLGRELRRADPTLRPMLSPEAEAAYVASTSGHWARWQESQAKYRR